MTARNTEKGAVLLLTFIIMITLIVITVVFLFMISVFTKGAGYDIASSKALWLAEAGLQQVIYNLKNDSDYRDNPTTVNGNLGDGSYSVSVSKNGSTYTLSSIGTVSVLNRKITQTMAVSVGFPDAFDYAVFGNTNSNTLQLKDNVAISGDVYYDGDVDVDNNASVTNGLVYADNVTGGGTYTEASGPPDPVPTYPTFDTTTYDNQIATAEGQVPGDWTLNGSNTYDLTGGTLYVNGKVTVKDSAAITGSGTIAATDDIKFENSANITQDVIIIGKKKIEVKNNAVVQSGAVLYSRNEVKLKDNASVTGNLLVPTSGKKVKIEGNAALTGIIYADQAELKNSAVISGSVVANKYKDNRIKDNVSITYNAGSLPTSVPTGLEAGSVSVTPQKDWNEVVPAS